MDRRAFARTLATGAFGTAALPQSFLVAESRGTEGEAAGVPYKLSVMLWTVFGDLPFEARLEKITAAGYRAIQLVNEFARWTEDDLRGANRKRRSLGMVFDTLLGNGAYTSKSASPSNPKEREGFLSDIRHTLSFAQKLECPTILILSGNVVEGMPREAQHASLVEGLKRAAEIVEGKDVTLLLENINLEENPRYFLWSVPEAFKIIEEVGHPHVKFLYDFFHAQISGGNLISLLEKNATKVGGVHIADVPGRHEPGTGEINYPNIFGKLAEFKFTGYVAMEFIPSRDPVESLKAAREMALRAGCG